MGYRRIPNINCTSEAYAYCSAKMFMSYASIAKDGTIFVPSPIAMVASRNLAICMIGKEGEPVRVFSNTLYANPDIARKRAKEMCEDYERMLENESL